MGESKRFYWLKLKSDFFEDDTIRFIEEQENGVLYVNFYLKLCLKSIINDGKLIRFVGNTLIPYDVKSLSKLTNTDVDTVMVAMELFKKIGLIEILDTGEIYLSQINEMIGSETDKAQLMRKKRARKKLESNIVTQMLPECYTENRDKSIEYRDIDKEKNIKKETYVSIVSDYTENQSLKSSLDAFIDMRKKMKGFTVNALKLALNKLDQLSKNDDEKINIVNQSVMNSWKSFYPLKDKPIKNVPDWYDEVKEEKPDDDLLNEILNKQKNLKGEKNE